VQGNPAIAGSRPAFYSLVLWQKAQGLAAELVAVVDSLPKRPSANVLGNQLLRSGTSAAANIAEGYGRYSDPAFRNHLSIARGSMFETESWLDLLCRAGYLTAERSVALVRSCEEVVRLVTAAMKPLKSARASGMREPRAEYAVDA